jgi:DNA-binding NarL/FixJ family response regulator
MPHVLIVDADAGAAQITAAVVQRITPGATVVCEQTPERGWLAAQVRPPDVLILDPNQHLRSAAVLIGLCRQTAPAVRIVMLASAPTPALRARATELQLDAYLEKPVASALLVGRLRGVLADERVSAATTNPPQA